MPSFGTPSPPFGELLRRLRARAGFSQELLADRAGVSAAAIGALEQGQRRAPYRHTIDLLAEALGLTADERVELESAASRARGRTAVKKAHVDEPPLHNLPNPLTSFVARDEVSEITQLLQQYRLVTVTGSGGIGKTRTAIEVARRWFQAGSESWFVDLFPTRNGSHVAAAIASALFPSGHPGDNPLEALISRLESRAALLVVDNCEHVVADAASIISALLRACRRVIVLATSREPLALSGEVTFRLPSLRTPDEPISTIEEVEGYQAVNLFVKRAQAADAHWSFDQARLKAALDICRQLEGIPLAIELAASRLPSLGVEALRERLQDGLTLLGSRDLPQRHQTMTAMITWSYDLLNEHERLLLRRLSVFAATFTLEAAENVCSDTMVPPSAIAETLSRLVQKSLINVVHVDDSTRYTLLGTIRAFAALRLSDAGEASPTLRRHADWLAGASKTADQQLKPAFQQC